MSDQNARRYELLYIIPTTFTDDEAGEIETRVSGLISKVGASVESTTRLGKLRFAYPVKDQRHGYYVQVMISAEPAAVAKLDMQLRITPEVLRHLILSAEEAGSEAKYELVQFAEVDINLKEDRPRRRVSAEAKDGDAKEGEAKPAEGEVKPEGEVKAEVSTEASKPAETV
jgi:small subunit ribosomal protein S6